ncbi:uncharacterized protein LOC141581532 [Saimiri boliviensis]|uniref:uncharacterized protein LOC141581532 n=1 Tax=Saimiri boliviensis TaxID=27679 RepID=UPI003D775657
MTAPASSQPRAPGFSSWPFSWPGASKVAVATVWSLSRLPSAQQSSPDRRDGSGGSERPRPLPRGGSGTVGCGRRLCSAASVAAHSAPLRRAGIRSPGAPCCLPLLLCCRPVGSFSKQDARSILLPRVYGFPGAQNFASVPTSISRPLSPSPRDSSTPWARARAHTHTLTFAGARAHARAPPAAESPAPLSRSPLSQAPLLTQASSRHGASSVCCSGGGGGGGNGDCSPAPSPSSVPGTESGRSKEGGRRAPGPAASLGRPGSEPGSSGLAHARAPGSRLGEEWARGEGSGARGEAGKEGCVDAWGLRCSPHTLPRCALAQAPSLLRARGCPAPQTAVVRSPRRPPASVGSGLRARARQSPPLHLGQRTPRLSPPAGVVPGNRSCPRSAPAALFFAGCHPPALHPFSSIGGGLRSAAGRKLSSPPGLRWVLLLLFVTAPSPGELGHLGQVLLGGSAPSQAPREAKEALGLPDPAAAKVQSSRLVPWTPVASPPLRTRHVRASHGRGPSQTTPRPPPARPQPPHRLDTRCSRVLIG